MHGGWRGHNSEAWTRKYSGGCRVFVRVNKTIEKKMYSLIKLFLVAHISAFTVVMMRYRVIYNRVVLHKFSSLYSILILIFFVCSKNARSFPFSFKKEC
jgi:hypothetical protein